MFPKNQTNRSRGVGEGFFGAGPKPMLDENRHDGLRGPDKEQAALRDDSTATPEGLQRPRKGPVDTGEAGP